MAENTFLFEQSRPCRKPKEKSFICVICLRLRDKRKLNHPQFFKAACRLLKFETPTAQTINNNTPKWPLCDNCFNLVEKALNLFKEIEVLKLRLNWSLGQIWDVTETSGRIPSRYRRFREEFGGNQEENEAVKIFRHEFLQKCKLRLNRGNPTIKLKKVDIKTTPTFAPEREIEFENQDELVLKTEVHDYDDYGEELKEEYDDHEQTISSNLEIETDTNASTFKIDDPDFCPPEHDPDESGDDEEDFSSGVNYESEPEIQVKNNRNRSPRLWSDPRTCTKENEKSKKSRVECTECGKSFASLKSLSNHRKMKHERHKWRFICPEEGCGRRCYDQQKLDNHRLFHSKEKTFMCDCGKKFRYPGSLRVHVKNQQCQDKRASKSVICYICGEKFSYALTLRAHIKNAHEGAIIIRKKRIRKPKPKTFVCDICGSAFSWDCKLRLHKKNTHGGPSNWDFTCPVDNCGKKCATRNKLNVHMLTHSDERHFVCDFCGRSYRHRQSLKIHVKNIHGKPVEEHEVQ